MTQTERSSRKVIVGSGWSNPLSHAFYLESSAHLKVYAVDEDGVLEELSLGADYSVANVGDDDGYDVTISTPGDWDPTSWVLEVEVPINQPADVSLSGTFGARYEDALDRLSNRLQRVYDMAARALKSPLSTNPEELDQDDLVIDPALVQDLEAAVESTTASAAAAVAAAETAAELLAAVEDLVAALGGPMTFKGAWDASSGTFPATAGRKAGWTYLVTVAGTVGGQAFELNDRLVALVDDASATVYAANWMRFDADLVQSVAGLSGVITKAALLAALNVGELIDEDDMATNSASRSPSQQSVKAYVDNRLAFVTPEQFGAVASSNLAAPVDATTALAAMVAYVNANDVPIFLKGYYYSTATLAFTTTSLNIDGVGSADSGFLFNGANGITLTQTGRQDGYNIKNIGFVTNEANLRKAFVYTGPVAGGEVVIRRMVNCNWTGLDRKLVLGTNVHGWLKEYEGSQCEHAVFDLCSMFGREDDRLSATFATDTYGIDIAGSTGVVVRDCNIFFKKTGIRVTGQSEAAHIVRGSYVANKRGILFESLTNPATGHVIDGPHIASYEFNIDIGSDGTATNQPMCQVRKVLSFCRDADVSAGFTHVKINSHEAIVAGNLFFTPGALDASCAGYTGVDVYGGEAVQVTNNMGRRVGIMVNVRSGVVNCNVAGNTTDDSATSLAVNPAVVDAGTTTQYGLNFGDRQAIFGPAHIRAPSAIMKIEGGGGIQFLVNGNHIVGFSTTSVAGTLVNFLDALPSVTGTPPSLRAQGTDANCGVRVTPKGTGLFDVNGPGGISIQQVKVVGPRATGWAAATGTATKTTFVTSTVTLPQLAERVKALIDDLITHGMIGT